MEIIFTLLYALLVGFYNLFKKIALKKSSESTILAIFTTCTFILSLIWIPFGIVIPLADIGILALKGFLIALSWFLTLKVLKSADLSIVTATNTLSAALSFILGIILFKETAGLWQVIGSILVIGGIAAINLTNKTSKGNTTPLQFVLLLLCAMITTSSNIIDKSTTAHLTSQQVQFWFLLFVCLFSWIFFMIDCIHKKEFLIKKSDFRNFWIYLASIFLFVGDFLLFTAYQVPNSQMITISVLLQLKVIVTVLAGVIIFKERNIWKKLIFTSIILLGAILIAI